MTGAFASGASGTGVLGRARAKRLSCADASLGDQDCLQEHSGWAIDMSQGIESAIETGEEEFDECVTQAMRHGTTSEVVSSMSIR